MSQTFKISAPITGRNTHWQNCRLKMYNIQEYRSSCKCTCLIFKNAGQLENLTSSIFKKCRSSCTYNLFNIQECKSSCTPDLFNIQEYRSSSTCDPQGAMLSQYLYPLTLRSCYNHRRSQKILKCKLEYVAGHSSTYLKIEVEHSTHMDC